MQENNRPSARLALVGDVMLGRLVNEVIQLRGASYPWGDTLPLLRSADLRLINLECVIAETGQPWTRTPKVFHFRADPLAIETLRSAAIDCVSLANNHVLDYEEAALEEMLGRLDAAHIKRAGAGKYLAEAACPALLTANGIRMAVLAFTDNEPGWAATPLTAGINFVRVTAPGQDLERFEAALAAARQMADVVMCSAHWGPNMRLRPPDVFREFAHRLLDRGVDLFYGHSAHVFQGIEIYRGKPILYDTGDFVDDYVVDPGLRNDRSFLFSLTVSQGGVQCIDLTPVLIADRQVHRATGRDFAETCQRMRTLSAEMGTELEERSDGLHLEL